tara:strand:- start:517 stop:1146 length:630 start_codon:yes stop_codon:yes gene_type:complete
MMQNSTMSDMIRQMMEQKQGGQGARRDKDMPKEMMMGQDASTVRQEQAPDGSMREFVWYTPEGDGPMYDAPDSEWEGQPGAIKIYGNWNEYAQGQDADGTMFLPDDQFPYRQGENGEFMLDESVKEGSMQSPQFEETMRGREEGAEMGKDLGGPGASPMEDLMQKLADRSRKMGMGGKIYRKGGKFPDLTGDGKVTFADILKGRGVRRR